MAAESSRGSRFELVDGPLTPDSGDQRPGPETPRRGPAVLAVAVAILLVLVAATVLPGRTDGDATPPPAPTRVPSPLYTTPSSSCDLADAGCRTVQARRWRDRTAAILREHLDPENSYFTGYSYSADALYDAGPRLNALGLEVYRLQGGSTEVFIQIAKTPADAVRCGRLTRHRCTEQQFMDGNQFALTSATSVAEGLEVQHIPTGTYVITLVARNTTEGRTLTLNNGDLIAVAEDPRLQPPPG